jgi:hypothetical protein
MRFILFILLILLIPLTSAQMIYKQSDAIDLKIPCYNSSNAVCSASAICNISINYPNETYLIKGKAMTNLGIYHNYTLISSQTQTLGEYKVYTTCQDGNDYGYSSFTYEITPTGYASLSSGEGTALLTIMIIILLTGIFFTILSFSFKNIAGKLIFGSFAGLFFMGAIMSGLVIFDKIAWRIDSLYAGYTGLWFAVKILISTLIIASLVLVMFMVFKSWRRRRGLE